MKQKIRELLFNLQINIFASPQVFAQWLLKIREQEKLFYKNSAESPEEYTNSGLFVKELFLQLVCLRFSQFLQISLDDNHLDDIAKLMKEYHYPDSIPKILSFEIDNDHLNLCAWNVSTEIDHLVNEFPNCIDLTDLCLQNFSYLITHYTGHGVRSEIRRFASNLSTDLRK